MTEQERLQGWMQENQVTIPALARETGMAYVAVFRMAKGDRRFSDGFKLRFVTRYGADIAGSIFEMPERQLEPVQ